MPTTRTSKSNDTGLPAELGAAIHGAEDALAKFGRFADVLTATGESIPRSLAAERRLSASLGSAEIAGSGSDQLRGELADAEDRRAADTRRRRAASDGLLSMADELREVRQRVEQARTAYAGTVVNEFRGRWDRCCRELATLAAESRQLSGALKVTVPTPSPYRAMLSVRDDQYEARLTVTAEVPALSPELTAMTSVVGRLDSAAGLLGALVQSQELTNRHIALTRLRSGMSPSLPGLYEAVKAFDFCGSHFAPGTLVSHDVIPVGYLHRLQTGRVITLIESTVASAA
jgi:hypothetical protein